MAAAAASKGNYEIGHNLKSIQVRGPIIFLIHVFRVRNAMKPSFATNNHGNYRKIHYGKLRNQP